MAKIPATVKRDLALIARPKNARSYRAWLTEKKSDADAKQSAAAAEASRLSVGYGRAGETLGRSSFADDGYAAYLRKAAKEARASAAATIEDERVKESRDTLAGYGRYLAELREKDAATLEDTAERLLALEAGSDLESQQLIAAANATKDQAAALQKLYKDNPAVYEKSRERVLRHLILGYYSYDEAYNYCRLIGLDDSTSRRLAEAAAAERSGNVDRLESLFGKP